MRWTFIFTMGTLLLAACTQLGAKPTSTATPTLTPTPELATTATATPTPAPKLKPPPTATYFLEIKGEPSEGGSVEVSLPPNQDGGYKLGTTLKLEAVPNPGFSFHEWIEGPAAEVIGTENLLIVTINSNLGVAVVFDKAAAILAKAPVIPTFTPTRTPTPVPLAPTLTPTTTPTPNATPTRTPRPTLTPTLTPPHTLTPTPTTTPHPGAVLPELVKVADLPGGDIVDIAFVLSSANVVYLASEPNAMGIWRSDDAGDTWWQVLADYGSGGPAHIHDMVVHPDNPNVVLVADAHNLIKIVVAERGVEWTIVYPPTPEKKAEQAVTVFAVGFSPSMSGIAYAVDEHGNILKSPDGGDTWLAVGRLEVGFGVSLAVDARDPDTLYVGTGTGVSKSTDGGQNWQQVLPEGGMDLAIAPGAPDLVFAAGGRGIFKSTDGGETWRRTRDRHANSVQVAPSSPHVVYAGTSEGVLNSSDGGETWVNRSMGIKYPSVGILAVHPGEQNTVIAGSSPALLRKPGEPGQLDSTQGEGIYKTIDGGLSWVRKGSEFIDVDVVEVAVDPSNPNVVYAGTRCSRGVYRTEDGGASWIFLSKGPRWAAHYTMRIATAAGSIVWLTGNDGMEWSNDGGETWDSALNEQQRHFHGVAISPHDPNLIFVGTVGDYRETAYYPGARILRSTDGGAAPGRRRGVDFPVGLTPTPTTSSLTPLTPKSYTWPQQGTRPPSQWVSTRALMGARRGCLQTTASPRTWAAWTCTRLWPAQPRQGSCTQGPAPACIAPPTTAAPGHLPAFARGFGAC